MKLEKFSFGMGDRFLHQGRAQLQAIINAKDAGVDITPVWNKSDREHVIVGTEPLSLRDEADAAISALNWDAAYRVDADHINMGTVDRFIDCSDFFTLDVGDAIGAHASDEDIDAFVLSQSRYVGELSIPGAGTYIVSREDIRNVAATFLKAVQLAGKIYRHIVDMKGSEDERFGRLHRRSIDGRDRESPDAPRDVLHPRDDCRRRYPGTDRRTQVHGAFQQGRGLRRRRQPVRERIQ
jgi:hypothetical protein